MSPLSAEYRASSAADSDDSDDDDDGEETTQGRAAHAHKVRLRFFAGGWSTLRECLAHQGTAPPPPYDIVLASETIYRTEALGAFLGVLRSTVASASASSAATMSAPAPCNREVEVVHPPLCLVAAKVLYFGVGGGVQAFVSAIEGEHGTVHTVWEHREGVGRAIMRIEW